MYILGDWRLPEEAKKSLKKFGLFVDFKTENITYDAISGHADIFFHKSGDVLVIAPNLPEAYKNFLQKTKLNIVEGTKPVGEKYPQSAHYNATYDDKKIYCNTKIVDNSILNIHAGKETIHFNQGYIACNMVIGKNTILSSDISVSQVLDCEYFKPSEILLPGMNNGFIGGTITIYKEWLLLNGSLNFSSSRQRIESFAQDNGLEIIELYYGPLFDSGGLLIIE